MIRFLDLLSALLLAALLLLLQGVAGSLLAQGAAPPAAPRDAFPPNAPPMPVCNQWREGVAACLGGKSCLCRQERGGSITGRPDGHRWDCGALRPACEVPPAALPPQDGGATLPWSGGVSVLPEVVPRAMPPSPWR